MQSPLPVEHDFSLLKFNTFGIDVVAKAYLSVTDPAMLPQVRLDSRLAALPRLILGGGSNLVLTRDFPGLVLHMTNKGIDVVGRTGHTVSVRAAAGEPWHGLVQWTLAHGFGGLENLSLIPGSVGASPIQNIGAYGVEAGSLIESVRYYDFDTDAVITLDRAGCRFGYRDSVFKHHLRQRAVIIDVTFGLPVVWQAQVQYAELQQELRKMQQDIQQDMPQNTPQKSSLPPASATITPARISEAIVAIRSRKLPDPARIGNAGSFFKNPLVSAAHRQRLLAQWPGLICFAQADGSYKLAAGWLIDQCGWKGQSMGAAGVYDKQALVLINRGHATGTDILRLANAIQEDVARRFGVTLEPEPIIV